ncbi:sigma-70 family RNA polymerase sigma factor [Phenylobacterium sp.]|uniref:RNA polymerase sigma factor n=1 Tax=Phenylobacterium sp. TaxID=1871053 RepID=UPI0025F25FE5|nr:sigma-70 family RNA polymerase sigma factor [Phenylobacterium sp.]
MLRRGGDIGERRSAVVQPLALDETRLIARIVGRDLRAFEQLYRIYHPRLSRFLINILRRPHLVEEALNDTLMVVWRRPEAFNGTSKVSTWIFAIAYRTALKARSRHDEPVEDPQAGFRASPDATPEQDLGRRQLQEILATAMGQLSPEHRAVVDLTYFHEAGYREIAEILDCPVGTVKTRMHHARRHLKGMVADQIGPDWW